MRIECIYDEARVIVEDDLLLTKTSQQQDQILAYFSDKVNHYELVILDLTACSLIDSMGVGLIATLYKYFAKYGVYFRVCVPQNNVFRVLQQCRMTTFMDIRAYPAGVRAGSLA
jgi:anti-anti-sigma factor